MKRNRTLTLNVFSAFAIAALAVVTLLSCSKSIDQVTDTDETPSINQKASPRTSTINVPYQDDIFVPCANGGAGETVHVTGLTNFVFQFIWIDHGFYVSYHSTDHNVTGVGAVTGDSFTGSGGIQGTAYGSWVNSQWIATTNSTVRLVGPSGNFNLNVHLHITVNPDGEVEVSFSDFSIQCI